MKIRISYYLFIFISLICDYFFAISLININLKQLTIFFIASSISSIAADLCYQNLLEDFNHRVRLNFLSDILIAPLKNSVAQSLNFLQETLPRALDYYATKIKSVEFFVKTIVFAGALFYKTPSALLLQTWPLALLLPCAFILRTYMRNLGEIQYQKSSTLNNGFVKIIMNTLFLKLHGLEKKGIETSQAQLHEQKKLIIKSHLIANIAQKLPTIIYFILFLTILKLTEFNQSLTIFYLGYKLVQSFSDFNNFFGEQELFKTQYQEAAIFMRPKSINFTSANYLTSPPSLSFDQYHIKSGELLFIQGPSGSGKTTLLYQLIKLKPNLSSKWNQEEICLDQLKSSLAFVGADNFFIDGSVRENLELGLNFIPSEKEIWEALKFFFVDEVVQKKPLILNEPMTNFSSGEKQRLALSRALLKKPLVLILDEATRHLDGVLTSKIIAQIIGLKGRITLIVADHNNEYLRNAEHVITINK